MQIEVRGREQMLDELRLHLQDQLEKHGFSEGPKVSSMDTGVMIDYIKNGAIISVQVTQESETKESILRVESEIEIPELRIAWDDALISYGKYLMETLRSYAVDQDRVGREIR